MTSSSRSITVIATLCITALLVVLGSTTTAQDTTTCVDGLCETSTTKQVDVIALEKKPGSTAALSPQSTYQHRYRHADLQQVISTPSSSLAYGSSDALVKVFVFVDFACPVCVRAAEPIKHLMRATDMGRSDVQLVIINLALSSHRTVCQTAASMQAQGALSDIDPSSSSSSSSSSIKGIACCCV
jgi:protein-disulfide isomerase